MIQLFQSSVHTGESLSWQTTEVLAPAWLLLLTAIALNSTTSRKWTRLGVHQQINGSRKMFIHRVEFQSATRKNEIMTPAGKMKHGQN